MRIRISDPSLLPELLAFLRSHGYIAEPLAADTVITSPTPTSLRIELIARQLSADLESWRTCHPDTKTSIVPLESTALEPPDYRFWIERS
jgi:hypothetical protein